MKNLQEYISESLKPTIFNEESKITMIGGKEKYTIFTIDGQSILGYAQGDEKTMMELIKHADRKDKIYVLDYNRVLGLWEGVITSYYTNAYGKSDDELMGASSNRTGITKEKLHDWAKDNTVLVKVA